MQLTTDRIVAIISGVIAAGGLSLGGLSSNEAATCRDLLADERSACAGTLEQVSEGYANAISALRDVCRD